MSPGKARFTMQSIFTRKGRERKRERERERERDRERDREERERERERERGVRETWRERDRERDRERHRERERQRETEREREREREREGSAAGIKKNQAGTKGLGYHQRGQSGWILRVQTGLVAVYKQANKVTLYTRQLRNTANAVKHFFSFIIIKLVSNASYAKFGLIITNYQLSSLIHEINRTHKNYLHEKNFLKISYCKRSIHYISFP